MLRTNIHKIDFKMDCQSGLHIGGSQDELVIGGADNPVIKNPQTRKPYIPGSSLKGKMRAELEHELGAFDREGRPQDREPCMCGGVKRECPICRVFGAHKNTRSELGPSRILVRDGQLAKGGQIENKTENVIDRQTGAAQHPRTNERVADGSAFALSIVLQVYDIDADFNFGGKKGDEALQAVLAKALRLVEATGLGGGTSRGSGAVRFSDFTLDGKPWALWSA